jgi:hypothetical protein
LLCMLRPSVDHGGLLLMPCFACSGPVLIMCGPTDDERRGAPAQHQLQHQDQVMVAGTPGPGHLARPQHSVTWSRDTYPHAGPQRMALQPHPHQQRPLLTAGPHMGQPVMAQPHHYAAGVGLQGASSCSPSLKVQPCCFACEWGVGGGVGKRMDTAPPQSPHSLQAQGAPIGRLLACCTLHSAPCACAHIHVHTHAHGHTLR